MRSQTHLPGGVPGAGIHRALTLPGGLSGRGRQLIDALDALSTDHRKVTTVPSLPTYLGSRGGKRIRSRPWVRICEIRALWPRFSSVVPTPRMRETSGSCAQGCVEPAAPKAGRGCTTGSRGAQVCPGRLRGLRRAASPVPRAPASAQAHVPPHDTHGWRAGTGAAAAAQKKAMRLFVDSNIFCRILELCAAHSLLFRESGEGRSRVLSISVSSASSAWLPAQSRCPQTSAALNCDSWKCQSCG